MRRSEKQITHQSEIDSIINQAQVCRLGLIDGDRAYIVPLCFGYDGDNLYFHCATEGRKLKLLQTATRIDFEIDIVEGLSTNTSACNWSIRYKSVIGCGSISFHKSSKSKAHALDMIMTHYDGPKGPYGPHMLEKVCTFSLKIEEVTAKQS